MNAFCVYSQYLVLIKVSGHQKQIQYQEIYVACILGRQKLRFRVMFGVLSQNDVGWVPILFIADWWFHGHAWRDFCQLDFPYDLGVGIWAALGCCCLAIWEA
jgi:hypothetical protein